MRQLGRMGERIFGSWCDSVGLTANKSDVLVEFSCEQNNSLPRDMSPAPIECKVQVKSTDHKRRAELITLSNLERLIKAKMPAFFCFIEFDGKNEAQAAYLVHVGEEIIEKTLKRIRKLDSEGKSDRLNQREMRITYKDSDRLTDTTGESLKRAIERYIPDTLEKYVENKSNLLKTLGFEDGIGEVTIMVSGNDPVGDVVDLSLGLLKEIRIDKSVMYDKRFGILSENQFLSFDEAILGIELKPVRGIIKFKKYEFSSGVSLNAEVYVSPFSQFLAEKKYHKYRVKSKMFEFLVEPFNGKVKFSYNFRDDRQNPLNELKEHLKVFVLLKKTSTPLIVEVSDEAKKAPPLPPFKISIDAEIDDWSDVYQTAERASLICQKFSISESNVLVTISELMQELQDIENFYQILHADPKKVRIDFPLDAQEYQQGDRLACASSTMATIGNHTIGCFWAIVGSLSLANENQYRLIADEILTGNELIAIDNEVLEQSTIDKKFDEFEHELKKSGLTVIRI